MRFPAIDQWDEPVFHALVERELDRLVSYIRVLAPDAQIETAVL